LLLLLHCPAPSLCKKDSPREGDQERRGGRATIDQSRERRECDGRGVEREHSTPTNMNIYTNNNKTITMICRLCVRVYVPVALYVRTYI
jgi:hypothetical protein